MVRLACVLTLVLACTKTSETTHPAPHPAPTIVPADAATSVASVDAGAGADATVITAAPATPAALTSCPKTYAIATTGKCSLASVDKLTCSYPDGHCSCLEYSPCAGWAGAYEQARAHPKAEWGCTPTLRPDGCPGDHPAPGSHCAPNGKQCTYASCGGDVIVCRDAAWVIARQLPPPP